VYYSAVHATSGDPKLLDAVNINANTSRHLPRVGEVPRCRAVRAAPVTVFVQQDPRRRRSTGAPACGSANAAVAHHLAG